MAKPESYPNLRIANKYGVPYDIVLDIADYNKPGRGMYSINGALKRRLEASLGGDVHMAERCFVEIIKAMDVYKDVRAGKYTWPGLELADIPGSHWPAEDEEGD